MTTLSMSWIEVIYEFVAAQLLGCGTMRLARTNNTSSEDADSARLPTLLDGGSSIIRSETP
jgi:hypothetical protein